MGELFKDTDLSMNHFVPDADPGTTTDPLKMDSDGDGVPDGWIDGFHGLARDGTFQFGEGEDKNFNGKVDAGETNPNAVDSDGDGLLDGWDILTSSAHSGWDNIVETDDGPSPTTHRYWGELSYGTNHNLAYLVEDVPTDIFLQQGPTDPTSIDSDGDGLIDGNARQIGNEFRYGELPTKDQLVDQPLPGYINTGQNIWTDPSNMDTDGDGLSDGMEFNGWEVNIIMEKTKERVETRQVHSDPAHIQFNNAKQEWVFDSGDGDNDGVSDYDEFLNSSDPNNRDTDGDRIIDGNEGQGELTQIEGKDPEILKFKFGAFGEYQVFSKVRWTWGETVEGVKGYVGFVMVVYVKAGDNAGLDYISIKIPGRERAFKYFDNAPLTYTTDDNDFVFRIDWSKTLLSGYDVNITVADVNGNGNYTNTHIDGLVEGIIKALVKAFKSFVEAVKDIISSMIKWLLDAIAKLFQPVIDKIKEGLKPISEKLCSIFIDNLSIIIGMGGRGDILLDLTKMFVTIFKATVELFIGMKVLSIIYYAAGKLSGPCPPAWGLANLALFGTLTILILIDTYIDCQEKPSKENPKEFNIFDFFNTISSIGLGLPLALETFNNIKIIQEGKEKMAFEPEEMKVFEQLIKALMLLFIKETMDMILSGLSIGLFSFGIGTTEYNMAIVGLFIDLIFTFYAFVIALKEGADLIIASIKVVDPNGKISIASMVPLDIGIIICSLVEIGGIVAKAYTLS
jgi:hypothetical protein